MKHSYIFAFLLLFAGFTLAQSPVFFDNFESYTVGGKLAEQNPTVWTTWSNLPGSAEDPVISDAHSFSPTKSVKIVQNNDLVKKFDNYTTGVYSVKFKNYIPTGKTGYFNVLHLFDGQNSQWGFECYFNAGGAGAINAGGANSATFTWIPDQWKDVEVRINLTTDQAQFYYDNTLVQTWVWHLGSGGTGTLTQLGGVDIFGAVAEDEHYIDDFGLYDLTVPVELTSFAATANNNSVTLNWSTATETNNKGFEVQKKSANSDFVTVGFVNGNGSSTLTHNYSFTEAAQPGTYTYRLRQIDFNGLSEFSNAVEVLVNPTSYDMSQNYPNPFNPSTKINFSVAKSGMVKLAVYNLLGQQVETLVNEVKEAGTYNVSFNATNLTSGVYFYKLETPEFSKTMKMILNK